MRIAVVSDPHCGHFAGLTPPAWQSGPAEAVKWQRKMWGFYEKTMERLSPIDALFILGDCVDGPGFRSGGSELIERDLLRQAEMAVDCLRIANCEQIHMVYGTPYHVNGDVGTDIENLIASELGAVIEGHSFVTAEGITFDLKHKGGSSSIPHGRGTPLAKERLWNVLWNEHDGAPKADIILRGHTHAHAYIGGSNWLAISAPALQFLGSKYGTRQCQQTIDCGILSFDVDGGEYSWEAHLMSFTGAVKAHRLSSTQTNSGNSSRSQKKRKG